MREKRMVDNVAARVGLNPKRICSTGFPVFFALCQRNPCGGIKRRVNRISVDGAAIRRLAYVPQNTELKAGAHLGGRICIHSCYRGVAECKNASG
jgi:hypothetical protein